MGPRQTEMLTNHCSWPILIGLILMVLSRPSGGLGGITGLALISLGASAGSLRSWRKEPGLWMLSAFFLGIFFPIVMLLACGLVEEIRQRSSPDHPGSSFYDSSVATFVFAVLVLFLMGVTRTNWGLRRKGKKDRFLDDF